MNFRLLCSRIVRAVAVACVVASPVTTSAATPAQKADAPAVHRDQQEPILISADPASGFDHPYYLQLPVSARDGSPILVALPTPQTSSDPGEYVKAADRIIRNAVPMLRQLNLPVLVPVLPRPPVKISDDYHINLYIPALSREALLSKDPKLARMDRQVLAMFDHARGRVRRDTGRTLQDRAIFVGFSAAGHFATRMAALHPNRVLAVWAGGMGGHPILPISSLRGKTLTYPVGVSDLAEVAGVPFDPQAFRRVQFMIVQGGTDTNSSLPTEDKPSDSYSFQQAQLVFDVLGKTADQRMKFTEAIYAEAGATAAFKTYPGIGHQMSPEIVRDLLAFIRAQLEARK